MSASRRVMRSAQRIAHRLMPVDGDVEKFVAAVATHRGRPIRLRECPLDVDDPSGLWVPLPDRDLVLLAEGITHEHRTAVVCHEMAHMLLGHETRAGDVDISLISAALELSIDRSVAARFFARHDYEAAEESEAETLATRIASELARRAATYSTAEAFSQDHISSRLR